MSVIVFRPSTSWFSDYHRKHVLNIRCITERDRQSYVELSGLLATWENLFRVMKSSIDTICSSQNFVFLYCETNQGLPIDGNGIPLSMCNEYKSVFGWSLFFIKGGIKSALTKKLLNMGLNCIITFKRKLSFISGFEQDSLEIIDQAIVGILKDFSNTQVCMEEMRSHFIKKSKEYVCDNSINDVRGLILLKNADELQYMQSQYSHLYPIDRQEMIQASRNDNANPIINAGAIYNKSTIKIRNIVVLVFVSLYVFIVLSCLAISVFKDADIGIKLLISFQGVVTTPLGVVIGYLYGKKLSGKLNSSKM